MSDLTNDKSIPSWARVVGFIGVPSVIAIYLVHSIVNGIYPRIDALTVSTNNLIQVIQDERNMNKTSLDNIWRATAADCVNTSQTETERNRCLGWEPLIK